MTKTKKTEATTTNLYAFWKYNAYPYMLGAPVLAMTADGDVKAKGYDSMRFTPILLLPIPAGEYLHGRLKTLEAEHRAAMQKLQAEFDAKIAPLHPALGVAVPKRGP